MNYGVFQTVYGELFKCDTYIYHYTSVNNAIKILHSKCLKFSSINNMNDTVEYKPKIVFDIAQVASEKRIEYEEKCKRILDFFNKYSKNIKLMCFSKDISIEIKKGDPEWESTGKYFDLTGRGFALQRMWAQYGANNEGVCLIINKANLIKKLKKSITCFVTDDVKYENYFDNYKMQPNEIDRLSEQIDNPNGILLLSDLIKKNNLFLKRNYFAKLDDWQNEHEYRILALVENDNDLVINNLFSYLEGIVVGERIDSAYESALSKLSGNGSKIIPIKKIMFDNFHCRFKE